MKYRRVGSSGLKISTLGCGTWINTGDKLSHEESLKVLTEAWNQGIDFFDTADVYAEGKAEEILGEFCQNYDRKDLVLSSKVIWPMGKGPNDKGLGRKHIRESIERSLKRLKTDYLDIYFCHHYDLYTPLEETILTMTHLVEEGKILYWGTSLWTAHQIERVHGMAKALGAIPPTVEQPRYNLLDRTIETNILDAIRYNRMGLVIWSPLFFGVLTGKYLNGVPKGSRGEKFGFVKRFEQYNDKIRKLDDIAKSLDITLPQLSLAWILRLPEVAAPIIGASNPDQIISNVKATEVDLKVDTLEEIEKILENKPEIPYPYNSNKELDNP